MEVIIGIVIALLGALFVQTKKKNIAEARNENIETKEKINDIDVDVSKNQGQIESEEAKQKQILEDLKNGKQVTSDSVDALIDFFKKR